MTSQPLNIVWFKRDLRAEDHRPLAAAAARGPVLPLYVAEPALWSQPTMSARQWAFVAECLWELRRDLGACGQPLVVRVGDVVETLRQLHREHGVASLHSHEETGDLWTFDRDQRVAAWAAAAGVPWTEHRQSGVIRRIKSRNGWAKAWDGFMAEPATPKPALTPIDDVEPGGIPGPVDLGLAPDPCPGRQEGGRTAGLETLKSFLDERGETYRKDMSSPIAAATACSRLSPHLAWGAVASREAAQALWMREAEVRAGTASKSWAGSLTSFSGRLHWRDHFMQKLEDEPTIETLCLHPAYEDLRPREPDADRLAAWSNGETGYPFLDACMRSLRATGWINFRMRAMLVSFASYQLWLDWRASGPALARLFTDYEPGIHWPQMQMQSGATGVNTVRIYNPLKQAVDQDPTGSFTREWVPELADVPDAFLQEPWKWEGVSRILGRTYPAPIVDHMAAARTAREAVWGARRSEAAKKTAAQILDKHGSRKRTARRGPRKAAKSQLSLDVDQ